MIMTVFLLKFEILPTKKKTLPLSNFCLYFRPNDTSIEVNGTGNFRNEVVFAKMTLNQKLQDLWQNIGEKLVENSIMSKMENFTPHLTLLKLSRMNFKERKNNEIKKIPVELYDDKWQNHYFGCQKINSVQVTIC